MVRPAPLAILAFATLCLPGCLHGRFWRESEKPPTQPQAVSAERRNPERVVAGHSLTNTAPVPGSHSVNPPLEVAATPPRDVVALPASAKVEPRPEEQLKPIPGPDPAGTLTKVEPKVEELSRLLKILKAYQEDRPEEALLLLKQYPSKDQELLLALLPIIAQVDRKGSWHERLDVTQKLAVIDTLRSLTATLQQSAPLRVKKAEFARNITGFGRFEPVASPVFRPGDRAELYAEIENLNDHRFNEERYLVRLGSKLIINEDRSRLELNVPSTPDWSRSERQDHHVVIGFTIPPDLKPGVYTLQFCIVDVDANPPRRAEQTLTFRVASRTAKAE
jgi:hypothetical protein